MVTEVERRDCHHYFAQESQKVVQEAVVDHFQLGFHCHPVVVETQQKYQ
jgi:hypothetical protein